MESKTYNHAIAYSMITYICAYLRCYHPLEFTTAYFKNAKNKDDLLMGNELIKTYGFNVEDIRFRFSQGDYVCYKTTNTIYKGIGHIKNMGIDAVNELDRLGKVVKTNDFIDFLMEYGKGKGLHKNNVAVLISLDYFKDFGKSEKLMTIFAYYLIMQYKNIKKESKFPFPVSYLAKFCEKETATQYTKFDLEKFLREVYGNIKDEDLSVQEIMKAQLEYTRDIYYTNEQMRNVYVITELKKYKDSQVYLDLYSVQDGRTFKSKVMNLSCLKSNPIEKESIIMATQIKREFIKKWDAEQRRMVKTDKMRDNLYGWKTLVSLSDPAKKMDEYVKSFKTKKS